MLERAIALKKRYFPGLCVSVTIGIAALFISQRYGAPVMLMALLLGMAFNFLRENSPCSPGIEFSAKNLLRIGVALLGLRISYADVVSLGWPPIIMVCTVVLLTIGFGVIVSRLMGFSRQFGVLTAGSVAICGASAALAISSVLPANEKTNRDTLFTVITVTTLSTIAMVFYPILAAALNLTPEQSGMFFGGTIHDVAQVVGAGYSISDDVGALATFIKLLRVAMLVPVVLLIGMLIPRSLSNRGRAKVNFPGFLIGFVALFLLNSFAALPPSVLAVMHNLSSALLVTAIAALGVGTSLAHIVKIGWDSLLLVVLETVFIALLVLGYIVF